MLIIKDAFISYGRRESIAFAARLFQKLKLQGYEVWFDKVNIPTSEQWRISIEDGIRSAKNFIFVMAPHSVASKNCLEEIELAIKYGKRIIPIMHVPEPDRSKRVAVDALIGKYHRIEAKELVDDITDLKRWADSMENRWDELENLNYLHTFAPFRFPAIDDFDAAADEVMKVMEKHKSYVSTHTELLLKSSHWDKHGRATKYLLIGEPRKVADRWLAEDFIAPDQPPCTTTELICDYLSESTQNANNLLSEVFLCYSSKDKTLLQRINYALKRKGITTWIYRSDSRIGEDFERATQRGILQAANFVLLLSKNSLAAGHCMEELKYAAALNKRVIPIITERIERWELPDELKSIANISFIDCADIVNSPDSTFIRQIFAEQTARLATEILRDREYFRKYNMYLWQAERWQKQNKNESILLRGYNLSEAQAFFNQGLARQEHKPLPLQKEFIEASEINLSNQSTDVFISYSRSDADFARKLNHELQLLGKITWFDQESIAKSSPDFEEEIYKGINNAACFLLIISDNSLASQFCIKEVAHAARSGKKIVTVLFEKPEKHVAQIPEVIKRTQWVDAEDKDKDFTEVCGEIMRNLDVDRNQVNAHTKWLAKAQDWEKSDKKEDYLLAPEPALLAQEWLKNSKETDKKPRPTALQEEFIRLSIKAVEKAKRRRERAANINKVIMYFAVFVGIIAMFFAIKSERRGDQLEKIQAQQKLAYEELYNKNQDLLRAKQYNDSLDRVAREATGQTQNLAREKAELVENLLSGDKSRDELAKQLGNCQSEYQLLMAKIDYALNENKELKAEKIGLKNKLIRYNRLFDKELDKIFAPNSVVGNNKEGMKAAVRENARYYRELEREIK